MQERKQEILRGLEAMRENLEAFADEMWATVDHKDMATFASRVAAYQVYANAIAEFGELADKLTKLVETVPNAPERTPSEATSGVPHTLYDEFTFKKPAFYVLRGKKSQPFAYWSDLYVGFCKELAQLNPARFAALPADPQYLTKYGNRWFDTTSVNHIRWHEIVPGVIADINVSANAARNMMRQLLPDFGLKIEDMVVYFAEE